MAPPTLTPTAWKLLAALALIWGASFLSIRVALDEIPVATAVAHRVGWAALILWAVVAARRLPVPRTIGVWRDFAVMGLLNNLVPFSLMAWGQLHIETGLTSIYNAATAIFGVLVAAALLADESLTWRRAVGVALGFAGVSVAIGIESLARFDLRSAAQLAVLGGAFSYALAGAWARTRLRGLAPEVAAAGMLTASAVVAVPAAWMLDGPPTLNLAPRTLAAIAYYSVVATAVAYLLYYRILAVAGSGNAMLVTLMIPPVAIVLGWAVLGETLAPRAYLGFAILAVGLGILNGWPRRRQSGALPPAPLPR